MITNRNTGLHACIISFGVGLEDSSINNEKTIKQGNYTVSINNLLMKKVMAVEINMTNGIRYHRVNIRKNTNNRALF